MSNVKVQLIADHTHAGIHYHAEDVIEVTAQEAEWLAAHRRIATGNKAPKLKVVREDDSH